MVAISPSRRTQMPPRTDEAVERPCHLVLIDDDQHTYEYVIGMLGEIFGYAPPKAFALARIVDTEGRVTVATGPRERCEVQQARIHAYGPDPRIPTCVGSMSAEIEEAD